MTSDAHATPLVPDCTYEERYTDAELVYIIEQGMMYMCACPAQVADTVRKLRSLLKYQMTCSAAPENDATVHAAIAKSTIQSHQIMQNCLDEIIVLEKWDRATLQMPPELRKRQMQEMLADY